MTVNIFIFKLQEIRDNTKFEKLCNQQTDMTLNLIFRAKLSPLSLAKTKALKKINNYS